MNRQLLPVIIVVLAMILSLGSCTKESLTFNYDNPIDIELSSQWIDDSLDQSQSEKWFRVAIGPETNEVFIEWSEKNFHGSSRDYSADILVDAFWLDGETDYFVNSDEGYGTNAKLLSLSESSGLLIRVRMNGDSAGTFGLKVYEKETGGELELLALNVGDVWYEGSINENQTLGFIFSGGVADQEVIIQWAEFDSPENGYTADIKGSVYMLDQETEYKISNNGKGFVGKDSSHSDNPKAIMLDKGETSFIVIISLNDQSQSGSFAIQAK